jgi:EAL domain-containing protein (putative c-di-GMP-specific phosphodiesterase class I)
LVAERLGITLIAEGIETDEECQALATLGIDLMQGYLFARPQVNGLPLIERLS